MTLLKAQFGFLIIFILIPLLIHLMKQRTLKTVAVSSLYLFYRKGKHINRNLKLNRILLLLARLALVALVAVWFMHLITTKQLPYLSQWFPFEREISVFLDNRWDSRDSLISKWKSLPGLGSNPGVRFLSLFKSPNPSSSLSNALKQQMASKRGQTYLMSRFYGTSPEEFQQLDEKGISPLPIGPEKIYNTALLRYQVTPANPLRGEELQISGWAASSQEEALKISLNLENLPPQNLLLTLQPGVPAWFEFQLKTPDSREIRGELSIPKDGFSSDNRLPIRFKIRSSMRVAFVDDGGGSQSKTSKLYYIRQFFTGMQKSHPGTDFEFQDFSSAKWASNGKQGWDWAILGELENPVWAQGANQVLAFPQRNSRIQRFFDAKLEMRSYAFETTKKILRLPRLQSVERPLIEKSWECSRYLQLRVNDAVPLIFSGKEILFFQKGQAYFSAFDWSEYDFSAIYHAYFPVFLYRLFASRWPSELETPKFNKSLFQRDPLLVQTTQVSGTKGPWVDFSEPLLLLAICLCLLEILLVLRIERLGKAA
jgi:hypothetical protein